MKLNHDFFQVRKLSEDQKKRSSPNMEQVKTKKKRSSTQMEHFFPELKFFPRIQVETFAQMHTRVKLLEGMQMKTILKLLGGIYPPSPRFWHPCQEPYAIGQQQSMLRSITTKTNFNF